MLPILTEAAQIPGLFKEIYGDLAKPGVTQVGQALSTILGLGNTLLWPIQILNERAKLALSDNLDKYRIELANVSADDITAVSPELGVPISERLAYVTDDQLSQLYVNLLAKASTVQTAHLAHPSFVNIINNLSPDEALLLKELHTAPAVPFVSAAAFKKDGSEEYLILAEILTGLEDVVPISFPENIVAYFSNFEGLGLVSIRRETHIANASLYQGLEDRYRLGCAETLKELYRVKFKQELPDELFVITFRRGNIVMTSVGKLFTDACIGPIKARETTDNINLPKS